LPDIHAFSVNLLIIGMSTHLRSRFGAKALPSREAPAGRPYDWTLLDVPPCRSIFEL
jgi:hypothetical protein